MIEKKIITKIIATTAVMLIAVSLFTSCGSGGAPDESLSEAVKPSEPVYASSVTPKTQPTPTVEEPNYRWTQEDVEAMALTLAGECYDDKPHDKRLVCEVILNRVCNGYGDTSFEVCSAPHQFNGYTHQSRPVSENDYDIVIQTLKDWHDNDYQALSKYLFFSAGDNSENIFREEY